MVELAQLCTAPHLEFLISSLDWVSRAPRRAPRITAPTACLRPAAYPPSNGRKRSPTPAAAARFRQNVSTPLGRRGSSHLS
jgi:hypothetical protein